MNIRFKTTILSTVLLFLSLAPISAQNTDAVNQVAELRRRLLLLTEAQLTHFTNVITTHELPEESIGRTKVYESTIHLNQGDDAMIKVEPKAENNYYFNRLKRGMTETASAKLFAVCLARMKEALPEYNSVELKPVFGIPNRRAYTLGKNPTCKITLSRTVYQELYTVSITISSTVDEELELEDLLD